MEIPFCYSIALCPCAPRCVIAPLPSLRDSACGIVAIHNLAYFAFHHLVIALPHFRHCERSEAHICVSKFAHTCKSIILYEAIFAMESLNQLKRILNFFIRGQGVLLAKRPPYPLKPPTPSTLHLHYCAYHFRHCPPFRHCEIPLAESWQSIILDYF